jgi:hypothetical protein
MISAYERGRAAAQHGKHIQACPFDTSTNEWRSWRNGFYDDLSSSNDPARQLALRTPMPNFSLLLAADFLVVMVLLAWAFSS